VVSGPLFAVGGSMTDQAVTLTYPATHWSGMPDVSLVGTEIVPATSVVSQSGWWYRVVGVDTREHPFPPPDEEIYAPNKLQAHWNNVDGKGFEAWEYTDVFDSEGPSGTVRSVLGGSSTGASPVSLVVFHYLDPQVGGSAAGDIGTQLNPRYLNFADAPSIMSYRSRSSTHFQVGPAPTIRSLLNDTGVDNLNDSGLPFASGDVTAAFQFSASAPPAPASTVLGDVVVTSNLGVDHIKGTFPGPASGFPELLVQDPSGPVGWALVMRRTQFILAEGLYSGTADDRIAGVDDFNSDSEDELVVRNVVTGVLRIGGATVSAPPAVNWAIAATGDFDADGRADILWRNATSQKLVVWLMNGATKIGNLIPSPDQAIDGNWTVVGAADFNHDFKKDLLWYNQTSGKCVIWYMGPNLVRLTGGFTNPANVGNANWKALVAADLGKGAGGILGTPDIVWQNSTSKKLVVWHMDFSGNRTSGVFTDPDTAYSSFDLVGPR